jgi:hypothetical protein
MSHPSPKLPLRAAALLVFIVPGGLVAAGDTPPSPKIQHRIDALLKHRLKPEALPINPPNPFQVTVGAKREGPDDLVSKPATSNESATLSLPAAGEVQPKDVANASPAEVLIACASRLKLGGIIMLKEQLQIVVNGSPRKEGDVVAADWNNTIVYLRIVRLLPGQLVLRYREAETTVKF